MGNSRKVVLKLLTKIDKNSSYSNILLDDGLAKSNLSLQDKKFAAALFYGVLERKITLDAVIKKYSNRPSDKLNVEILNLLRMGIYQLCYMDSVPDSAAVDECVKLAKANRNPAVSGFVNGLLRSFIRDDKRIPKGKNEIENLSIEYSCPEWLVKKWNDEYGDKITLSMLKTSLGQAPTTIKTNQIKCSAADLFKELNSYGIGCEVNPNALSAINIFSSGSVESLEQYKKGFFHVQDISSQLCCAAVDPKEGDTVLDICSAPGGKTFTLAEIMNNRGRVFAFDLHENRVKLIRQGAERLGLSCVSANINNGKVFNELLPPADRVLCDVPCSGLGVIRRKPEIKYKNPDDFKNLPEIQYEILNTSSKYVKKGGVLVYSTCTLSRAENDCVIDKFLANHKDFGPCMLDENIFGKDCGFKVTITPDKFNSDGFFIAKLVRLR